MMIYDLEKKVFSKFHSFDEPYHKQSYQIVKNSLNYTTDYIFEF